MPNNQYAQDFSLNELFPESGRILLTGGGKEFIERIGIEATRQAVLNIMLGENVRDQTEPLTRLRIAEISGAIVALFANGHLQVDRFTERLSELSVQQIRTSRTADKANLWLAQWLIGLTGKSDQNVLRRDPERMQNYITRFESAIEQAAAKCRADIGDLRMTLGFVEDPTGKRVELDWKAITRLTTAIGSQTLTIRGSDKSIYGKLFERLILGSFLTILGFQRVHPTNNLKTDRVFWLSDSSDTRESDATLLYKAGKLARFDIGFIGPGNSEISKDKLSRYAREMEIAGSRHNSVTFIVVDRLPATSKTQEAADKIGAEIIQMSMQYWPRLLAARLGRRLAFTSELEDVPNSDIKEYLTGKLETIRIQDFLVGVSLQDIEVEELGPEADGA